MLFWVGWHLSRLVLSIFGRCQFIDADNVPKTGPVIIAPNHISYLDPPAAGSGYRRVTHFMAKEELFKIPVLGWLIKAVGSFPVKQHAADRSALKTALKLLADGEVVCVFPEGTRNFSDSLLPAQAGVGMIVLKSRAPVVPAAIIGTDRVLRRHSPFLHFGRVKIVYGKPMMFDDLYDRGTDREAVEETGRRIMHAIASLVEKHKWNNGQPIIPFTAPSPKRPCD